MSKKKKQKTDKQIFHRWVIVMVLAFLAGVFGGSFSRAIIEWFMNITSDVKINMELMLYLSVGFFMLVNVIGLGITFVFYKKAKNMTKKWDGEDEDVLDAIEDKLDIAMLPITIMTSVNYFLFGLTTYIGMALIELKVLGSVIATTASILIFVSALLLSVALQKKCVDLTKQLNPEKKGNIFDKNFSKEWLASCDEAQQLMIYKASYAAYKSVGSACRILWLVTIIGMMSFDTGLLPVFCVSAIMLVMQISYFVEAKKLERGKR